MKEKFNKIQILRIIVQLIFIPGTKDVSTWRLPTVLQAGVFFCGWVSLPFGAAQD